MPKMNAPRSTRSYQGISGALKVPLVPAGVRRRLRRGARRRIRRLLVPATFEDGEDRPDAVLDAPVVVAGLEPRRQRRAQDAPGDAVGQEALEAVADFDPHPALLRRHDQEHAVVLPLLAEFPGREDLHGELLDAVAAEAGHREHGDLVGRGLLVRCQDRPRSARGRPGSGCRPHRRHGRRDRALRPRGRRAPRRRRRREGRPPAGGDDFDRTLADRRVLIGTPLPRSAGPAVRSPRRPRAGQGVRPGASPRRRVPRAARPPCGPRRGAGSSVRPP